MATDEEYLDSLLKSMTETKQQPRNMDEVMKSMNVEDKNDDIFSLSTDDLADMLDKIEEKEEIQPMIEEIQDEAPALHLDSIDMPVFQDVEEDTASDNMMADDDFIRKIIAQQEALEAETVTAEETIDNNADVDIMSLLTSENQDWDEVSPSLSEEALQNMDVTELIDNMEEMQDDLIEINDLLKKADSNEYVEVDNADMLALLGSMQEEEISEESIFWENDTDSEAEVLGIPEELLGGSPKTDSKDKKKKNKGKENKGKENKKGLFGKKEKKTKQKGEATEVPLDSDAAEDKSGYEKKQGRLAQFFTYLTEEEPEEDENTEILNELEREDAQKAKAKKKKADKKKNGKGNKKEQSAEKAAKAAQKQEKKEQREQKKQERRAAQKAEPSRKVLSRKGLIVLVAFCASLIAAVFALSIFLPDYVDKKEAREAFYVGDYETVYKLLYGKQLNDNDRLIFERVETVLSLQRKLDSYENNKALGRDVEALQALLEGVERYSELENAAGLGIQGEADGIYNQMCGILLNSYGLTPEDVSIINNSDDLEYSRMLYDLVSGIGFVRPGEEAMQQENLEPQDILPEEEEIINLN